MKIHLRDGSVYSFANVRAITIGKNLLAIQANFVINSRGGHYRTISLPWKAIVEEVLFFPRNVKII